MDIFEIEKRGMFSPPNGNHPQIIPDYWRENPGDEIRTDLPELTDEELNALGWKGPIQMPPISGTSYFTHNYEWNNETISFDAIEIDEFEKQRRVDYKRFWNYLINTSAYSTIKDTASQSLPVNTLATEFIVLISDAKSGDANVQKIQEALNQIISNVSFSSEELDEIQEVFANTGMFAVYSLS